MISSERTQLTPIAREIKNTGSPITNVQYFPDGQSPLGIDEARQRWAVMKPEFYALTAVVADEVMQRALDTTLLAREDRIKAICEQKDAYGFTHPLRSLTDFTRMALRTTLVVYINEYDDSYLNEDPNSLRHKILKRYFELEKFHSTFVRPEGDLLFEGVPSDPFIYLSRGIGNAAATMAQTMEAVHWVFKREFPGREVNEETLTDIFANSYSLIAALAMMHLDSFSPASADLRGVDGEGDFETRFRTKKFTLEQRKNGLALVCASNLDKYKSDTDETWYGPHLGCPAMVNFGEGSAVEKFFNWHVQFAPVIYRSFFESLKPVDITKVQFSEPINISLEELLK